MKVVFIDSDQAEGHVWNFMVIFLVDFSNKNNEKDITIFSQGYLYLVNKSIFQNLSKIDFKMAKKKKKKKNPKEISITKNNLKAHVKTIYKKFQMISADYIKLQSAKHTKRYK